MVDREELDKIEEMILSGNKVSNDDYLKIIRRKKVHLRSQLNMINSFSYSDTIMDYVLEAVTSDIIGDSKYLASVCRYMISSLYQVRYNRIQVLDDIKKIEDNGLLDNTSFLINQYNEIMRYDKLVGNLHEKITDKALNDFKSFDDPDCIKDDLIELELSKQKIHTLSKKYFK